VLAGSTFVGCGVEPSQGTDNETRETVSVTSKQDALVGTASFLVSFANGSIPANADAVIANAGGTMVARYPNLGVVLAKGSAATFASSARRGTGVDAVGVVTATRTEIPRPKGHAAMRPHGAGAAAPGQDPLSARQWDMDQIRAPQARAISGGKKSVLVGVLDSGIDVTHPDLVGPVKASASVSCLGGVPNAAAAVWANDIVGHGTHVAGVIAGAKNGVGIVGVAPGVQLAAVKVVNDDVNDPNFGLVFPDAMVCAMDWAIGHGFDLMNASLMLDPLTAPIDDIFCSDQPDREAVVKIMRAAVGKAAQKKIPLISSTGNFFTDLSTLTGTTSGSTCKVLPVQLPRVIGVSAVGFGKQMTFYSNYGFGVVDVTAPGGDSLVVDPDITDTVSSGQILSSVPAGSLYYQFGADWDGQVQDCGSGTCATYVYLQGTSQATPHVTGVAALILSRFGRMTPETLLTYLSLTARKLPCPVGAYDPGMSGTPATCKGTAIYNNFYGAGEVDALAAVR